MKAYGYICFQKNTYYNTLHKSVLSELTFLQDQQINFISEVWSWKKNLIGQFIAI